MIPSLMNSENPLIGKVYFLCLNLHLDLGLNDYPELIKKPMDLSTLRKNLAKGRYKRYEEFFKDIQLIWDNCKTYNIQGSDIYKQAEGLEKISKRFVNKFKEEAGMTKTGAKNKKKEDSKVAGDSDNEDEEESEDVPFEKKVNFTEKVRRLTNEGLTKLVKKVKDLCPKALEDVDEQKLHIKVDDIDKDSFDKLDALVDENLSKATSSNAAETRKRTKL